MPYAKDIYTADGSTQTFPVTFPFISRDHVTVTADGSTATFTWVNNSSITITSPAALTTEQIIIKRQTSPSTLLVDFVDGSNLTETDLDLAATQQFYLAQENLDETGSVGFADLDDFSDTAVATTDADILVTNGTEFTNVAMSGDATIANTGAVTIANNAITSDKILDGTIVDADINASAGIDATKIADGSVTDTEFQYINSVTSNVQTQLDNLTSGGSVMTTKGDLTGYGTSVQRVGVGNNNEYLVADSTATPGIAWKAILDEDTMSSDSATDVASQQSIKAYVDANTDLVNDTSPQLGGFLDTNGNYIQKEKGGDIASANPLVIDTDGDYFDVTGTTSFSSMTVAADREFTLQFDGVLTLTHGASLILPADTNITTAAGDILRFQSTAADTVIMVGGVKADGTAWAGGSTSATDTTEGVVELATDAELATGTDTSRACTPANIESLIVGKTDTAIAAGDSILFEDVTDNALKKDTVQGILDLVSATSITLGTPVASTSGASIDFTGIPSGTKRITITFEQVSTSGTSNYIVQLGDSGGVETSGYEGSAASSVGVASFTTGLPLSQSLATGSVLNGSMIISLANSSDNMWVSSNVFGNGSAGTQFHIGGGSKSLSAELDRVRITTVGGTDTFDAGEMNITYE